jgi:2-phospho-L-lactate guanylyltransferase
VSPTRTDGTGGGADDGAHAPDDGQWDLLIPVKRFAQGKSRLVGMLPSLRQELARSFALDTIDAASASARVGRITLVTDEPFLIHRAGALGVAVVPDEGAGDLNAALVAAMTRLPPRDDLIGTAVVPADLPRLLAVDLDDGLAAAAGQPRSFLADHRGTGTTLLTAFRGHALGPRFGPDSASRHAVSGAQPIQVAAGSLRRDVDVPEDLDPAAGGVFGRHTHALLHARLIA